MMLGICGRVELKVQGMEEEKDEKACCIGVRGVERGVSRNCFRGESEESDSTTLITRSLSAGGR